MSIVLGLMLCIFCIYETYSLIRDIKKRRKEKRIQQQNNNFSDENKALDDNVSDEVRNSDDINNI